MKTAKEKELNVYINNIWMFLKSGQDKSGIKEIERLKKEYLKEDKK